MSEKRKKGSVVSVTLLLRREANEKLMLAAKAAGRSKSLEATLRLTQHLNTVPELSKDSYWEILLPKES
ncbi:TraY domain-containing protein [Citrobacter sp. TSA-1]|uniref:TraY domain-containing protein n=1 Tax=Citrobacter sp. TSA-1 TaxID=184912 RepID=UPI000BAE01C2|nr:TraY domain-containing protein [Citrobacter sp. TSA-1]PAX78572.1 traY domain protein [Citrobacter sp. TSA-1]QKE22736.1 TraY domain-containing protein [Citrobacter sp. TSA-1]